MKTAVCIMHYKRDDLTDRVRSELAGVEQVFVYDDGSPVPYLLEPGQPEPGLHRGFIIRQDENLGYVRAVNVAMKILGGLGFEAVWTLNNDISGVNQVVLNQLIRALESGVFDDRPGGRTPSTGRVAAVTTAVRNNAHPEMAEGSKCYRRVNHIDWVAPLVSLQAWEEVGGFWEELPGYGCDLDFCYAARQRGWSFIVLPHLAISHVGGGTVMNEPEKWRHSSVEIMSEMLCKKWGVSDWRELKL